MLSNLVQIPQHFLLLTIFATPHDVLTPFLEFTSVMSEVATMSIKHIALCIERQASMCAARMYSEQNKTIVEVLLYAKDIFDKETFTSRWVDILAQPFVSTVNLI